MTFVPIIIFSLLIFGTSQGNLVLAEPSLGLIIILPLTYWLINMIWSVTGVISYNKKIEDEARRQLDLWNVLNTKDQKQFIININQKSPEINTSGQRAIVSAKPNIQDWLKSNPNKTINDYFLKFGR
jgi:hypothetical protein